MRKKNTIRLNESMLNRIIKESVKRVLRESATKQEIFTLDAIDITLEEGIDDMRFCGQVYHSADEAMVAAEECADYYSDDDDVILVSVSGNQFEDGKGNTLGEPVEIYVASNKDKKTTMLARRKSGYVNPEVDYYAM
nr:MAG TPA_asm: hypothetical protein [Caudoviricetes sp.]